MPDTLDRLRHLSGELFNPELLVQVVEGLPDALVIAHDDGEVILFNRMAELLFGYHRSEVLGRQVDMLVPDAVRGQHADHRERFLQEPRVRPMGLGLQLAGRHKSGREFPVEINLSPLQTTDGLYVSAVVRRRS